MPALSPEMTEGKVTKWHKDKGDFIQSGDVIVEIETDKAVMEVEAVDEGILENTLVKHGQIVKVNAPIATIITAIGDPNYEKIEQNYKSNQRISSLSSEEIVEISVMVGEILKVAAQPDRASTIDHQARAHRQKQKPNKRVFVVHGHDDGARFQVAEFLRKAGLEPIVLHEQTNRGRTIIEKFLEVAKTAAFAVILLTPDDVGAKEGDALRPRARQNVVFEFGFFIGLLGPGRVAALQKSSVDRPSDIDGVLYIPMNGESDWRTALAREMEAAGIRINWNKLMRG